jgi:hypothetical protein
MCFSFCESRRGGSLEVTSLPRALKSHRPTLSQRDHLFPPPPLGNSSTRFGSPLPPGHLLGFRPWDWGVGSWRENRVLKKRVWRSLPGASFGVTPAAVACSSRSSPTSPSGRVLVACIRTEVRGKVGGDCLRSRTRSLGLELNMLVAKRGGEGGQRQRSF